MSLLSNLISSPVYSLEQDTLLYDNTHYRPVFADRIMRLVYQRNRYKSLR